MFSRTLTPDKGNDLTLVKTSRNFDYDNMCSLRVSRGLTVFPSLFVLMMAYNAFWITYE